MKERQPQRIVQAALVESIGPISAHDLLRMPEDSWGILRDRITDRRYGREGLDANCIACGGNVYIKTVRRRGVRHPLFAHYSGANPDCPWHHGPNTPIDDARAAQYRGRQESDFHRLMCEQVAALVALDPRYVRHTVAEYLAPTETEHGRFPDVYVEWEGFGPFAVEFQLSGTFQTEISARCKHYEREGIPLLWILFGIDTAEQLPQSIIDVIRRHRGNAFVLDPAAVAASKEQKTLVLSCYLRNADGFDPARLVRFDELTFPRSKIPYFEDRIIAPLVQEIEGRRRPWFEALFGWDRDSSLFDLDRQQSLLVAAAFSIVSAANGKERNYASKHPNIRAMLNTYLNAGVFAGYADLLTQIIANSAMDRMLDSSVGEHLRRHRTESQAGQQSKEWRLLRELLPEALDPVVRAEMRYLDALPNWAKSTRKAD